MCNTKPAAALALSPFTTTFCGTTFCGMTFLRGNFHEHRQRGENQGGKMEGGEFSPKGDGCGIGCGIGCEVCGLPNAATGFTIPPPLFLQGVVWMKLLEVRPPSPNPRIFGPYRGLGLHKRIRLLPTPIDISTKGGVNKRHRDIARPQPNPV